MNSNHITLAVQPMVNPCTKQIEGGEVLVRWVGHDGVIRTPAQKDSIDWSYVDKTVIRIVEENAKTYQYRFKKLFLNVSEATLANDDAFDFWLATAKRIINQAIKIVVEITEQIEDETLKNRYQALKECGLHLALDDYATHHSNLKRLEEFSWDYVKFEANNSKPFENLRGIKYCKKKNIGIISEKVEATAGVWLSKKMGVELVQGFVTGKPEIMLNYNCEYALKGVNE